LTCCTAIKSDFLPPPAPPHNNNISRDTFHSLASNQTESMGCMTSRESNKDLEISARTLSSQIRPHASSHSIFTPPPPPTPRTPKRKASMPYFENPQRKWQRRQMGEELFCSAKTTPGHKPSLPEASCEFFPPRAGRSLLCDVAFESRGYHRSRNIADHHSRHVRTVDGTITVLRSIIQSLWPRVQATSK
jgi:hypothetical protein